MNKFSVGKIDTSHLKYRADIDGLRAIAVILVVLYHAFPKKMLGGFIGVDIFFIISGFLISTILFKNLHAGNFSIVDFYRRRVKRIFPALLAVLIACLVGGWFFLLSDEYRQLGKHVAGGATFTSNILLWGEAGYFDASAESKPLLHLWSLAVEEQFYIIWPLILALIWKRRWNLLFIAMLAVVSFSINIFYLHGNATAAFYSPLSRFWELLIGSMLAYVFLFKPELIERYKNQQSILGFLLLTVGLVFINSSRMFPGWWALFPTLGAAFIISAGPSAYLNKNLLSSRLFVWMGLISYPLYLWHWPIFSFLHIVVSATPTKEMRLLAIIISIVLAWLTYKFVEKPLRSSTWLPGRTLLYPMVMIVVGMAGYYCYIKDGLEGTGYRMAGKSEFSKYFDNTYPEWHYMQSQNMVDNYREDCNFYDIQKFIIGENTEIPRPAINSTCFEMDGKHDKSVFIWGDSHGSQLYYGLKTNLPANWKIMQVTSSACTPSLDSKKPSRTNYCEQSNWFARNVLKKVKPDVVIFSQHIGHTNENFVKVAAQLEEMGVQRIIFTGPVPHWEQELSRIVLRRFWEHTPQRTFNGLDRGVFNGNALLKENFQGSASVVYADLIGQLCNADGCLTYIGDDRMHGLTTWDNNHLTPASSDYLAKKLLVDLIINPSPAR